jgi:hypothetical protein
MPRTPEVCPTAFCPLSQLSNTVSSVLRILSSASHQLLPAFCPLPTAFCLLPSAFCLLLVLLITHHSSLITVHAQSATATLSGTVTDQNDAVVPGVNIAVISIAQGFQRSATTNDDGSFVVALLPPGNYTVKAEHQGFTPVEVRDVALNVNAQVTIRIQMKIGTLSQTVEIVDGASLINESPAVGTVVDRQFVANLPLNGRSFQSLITLSPGVVLTKSTATEAGQFSVNGQRANTNYFTVDGVSANASIGAGFGNGQSSSGTLPGLSAAGGTNNLVSVDALQEFKIQTSTYAPEFGRTPGAQVSIVTRSGTNEFHGTLFEYLRNDALDANDWFANSRRLPKPPLRQNDFGGVIGGPLYLPRFGEGGPSLYSGKDRTFFFFSYEGLRLRQPLVRITDVPSLTARQTAVAGTQPFLNAYPLPNGPIGANGLAEFSASFSNPSTLNATSIRIDHALNSKVTLFGRYNYAPSSNTERGAFSQFSLNTVSSTSQNTQTLTLGATMVITPHVSNELRGNYTRYTGSIFSQLDSFGGAIVPSDSLLFPFFGGRQDSSFTLRLSGRNSALNTGIFAANLQRQLNITDNLSVITGSHQLKFGVDYRRLFPVFNLANYALDASFGSIAQAVAGTGSSVAVRAFQPDLRALLTNLSAYAQDTWKVNRRLTLTYGLRYEVNPPPTEENGNEQLVVSNLDNPPALALAPRGTRIYKTTYNNFAPRFGLSYQLRQQSGRETIIRGGFGIFYDLGQDETTSAFSNGGVPFGSGKFLSNVTFPLTRDLATPLPFSLDPRNGFLYAFDPELKLPYTYQWNGSLEQSLGANQTLSISYVGAAGRRLLRQETLQNPNANFNVINVIRNGATSDYHALQIQFQRRLSRGIQALASYTLSKSLDIASNDSSALPPSARIDPRLDRGPSDFDIRNSLSGALTYNIPSPRINTFVRAFLRDWSIDAIFTARSATPVNVSYATFAPFGFVFLRPDLVQGTSLYIDDTSVGGGRRLNPAAFSVPSTARQGTLARNTLRGFPISQIDLALRRQFNITERLNLQFKVEAFNVFNHPNFGDPDGNLGFDLSAFGLGFFPNGAFGRSNTMFGRSLGSGGAGGGFNPLYQVGGPRSIQLSLKVQF